MRHDPIASFPILSPLQRRLAASMAGRGRVLEKMIVQVGPLSAAIVEIRRAKRRWRIVVVIVRAVVGTGSFAATKQKRSELKGPTRKNCWFDEHSEYQKCRQRICRMPIGNVNNTHGRNSAFFYSKNLHTSLPTTSKNHRLDAA
jgi:hypothetical protein